MMSNELDGAKVAFLVANEGVEQVELTEPWQAVLDAGGQPVLIAPEAGEVQAFNHLDKGEIFRVDQTVADAEPDEFVGLVLPGGVANPDQLRTEDDAVAFARGFFQRGAPVASICHAPWTLVEADVLHDRRITSWPSLRTDIRNAGGVWVDEEVKVCDQGDNILVSSRKPDDLPAFCAELVRQFAGARHAATATA
jgi:protease I